MSPGFNLKIHLTSAVSFCCFRATSPHAVRHALAADLRTARRYQPRILPHGPPGVSRKQRWVKNHTAEGTIPTPCGTYRTGPRGRCCERTGGRHGHGRPRCGVAFRALPARRLRWSCGGILQPPDGQSARAPRCESPKREKARTAEENEASGSESAAGLSGVSHVDAATDVCTGLPPA